MMACENSRSILELEWQVQILDDIPCNRNKCSAPVIITIRVEWNALHWFQLQNHHSTLRFVISIPEHFCYPRSCHSGSEAVIKVPEQFCYSQGTPFHCQIIGNYSRPRILLLFPGLSCYSGRGDVIWVPKHFWYSWGPSFQPQNISASPWDPHSILGIVIPFPEHHFYSQRPSFHSWRFYLSPVTPLLFSSSTWPKILEILAEW